MPYEINVYPLRILLIFFVLVLWLATDVENLFVFDTGFLVAFVAVAPLTILDCFH